MTCEEPIEHMEESKGKVRKRVCVFLSLEVVYYQSSGIGAINTEDGNRGLDFGRGSGGKGSDGGGSEGEGSLGSGDAGGTENLS